MKTLQRQFLFWKASVYLQLADDIKVMQNTTGKITIRIQKYCISYYKQKLF